MKRTEVLGLCLALAMGGQAIVTRHADAAGRTAPSYTAKADGYALWLPGRPQQSVKKATMPGLGAVSIRYVALSARPVAYAVVPTPLPPGYWPGSAGEVLQGIQAGFVSSSKGKLVSSRSIKLGRYPGREIVVDMGGAASGVRMRGRFFVAPKRSYQVMAMARPAQLAANKAQIQKVLDSFQILNQ